MKAVDRENKIYAAGKENQIAREEEMMVDLLPINGGRLLDVGCGEGSIGKKLADKGFDVAGIDFSEVAVKLSREKGLKAEVVDVDTGLPFENDFFDVIWAGDIVEHVFDPIGLLKEMKRIIKGRGMIVLNIPNEMGWKARLKAIGGVSPQSSIYRDCGQCKHHTVMSLELFNLMAERADLKIAKFLSICRFVSREFISSSRWLASVIGRCFVIKLVK